MHRIIPLNLKSGDTVRVVAPAGKVDPANLQIGLDWLAERYRVSYEDSITETDGYLAGNDDRRGAELQRAVAAPDAGAVIAARGGFGTSKILEQLNINPLASRPKWIVGSSDLTTLLMHLWDRQRLVTIHGPMAATIHRTTPADLMMLVDMLEGRATHTRHTLTSRFLGRAEGPIIGGNLTMLAHLMGSIDINCFNDAILFLEDVGEKPYRLDRYLTQLHRAGVLTRLSGIVLGEFTRCEAPDTERTVLDALESTLAFLNIPVAAGYPAAHGGRNAPFFHGAQSVLTVSKDTAILESYT